MLDAHILAFNDTRQVGLINMYIDKPTICRTEHASIAILHELNDDYIIIQKTSDYGTPFFKILVSKVHVTLKTGNQLKELLEAVYKNYPRIKLLESKSLPIINSSKLYQIKDVFGAIGYYRMTFNRGKRDRWYTP